MRRNPFEDCEGRPALELPGFDAHDEETFFSRVPSTDEEPDELFFSRVPSSLGEHEAETFALDEDDDFDIVGLDDEHDTGHNWQ